MPTRKTTKTKKESLKKKFAKGKIVMREPVVNPLRAKDIAQAQAAFDKMFVNQDILFPPRKRTRVSMFSPVLRKPTKVAIIGTTTTRQFAPYDDPDFEIWAQAQNDIKWSRWFEIHPWDFLQGQPAYKPLCEWLKGPKDGLNAPDGSKPVYMAKHNPEVPGCVTYPVEQAVKAFGTWFFTSTPAWALALAIMEGFKEIHFYGIDMADETEYASQKPGLRALVHIAEKYHGVKFVVPHGCQLLTPGRLYALDKNNWLSTKIDLHRADCNNDAGENMMAQESILNDIRRLQDEALRIQAKMEFIEANKLELPEVTADLVKAIVFNGQQQAEQRNLLEQVRAMGMQIQGALKALRFMDQNWAQ